MLHKSKIFLIGLIVSFSTLSLTACQEDHTEKQEKASLGQSIEVTVGTVEKRKTGSLIEVMGTVQAVERATIASRVNGHIVKLPVLLGSKVKKADLLVSISAQEISARLLQAQAQLSQAQRNLDREKKLLKKKASTPEMVKSLEDTKRIAEASYQEAKTMLSFTRIEAPFDGTITNKIANIGDLATVGNPLLTIENGADLQVIAEVPERLVLKVKVGDRMQITVPTAKLKITGTVTEVAPTTDPLSRTAPIKLAIEPHPDLRSGQFARVTFLGGDNETILVPDSSVTHFGQMERVFVANSNQAQLRLVRTGAHHDDKLEILSGLKVGETIITQSSSPLTDGQPIIIKK